MKKSILLFASICAIALTSCDKDDPATTATTTATPVNPYTEIGLDQIGGNYSGSVLTYVEGGDPKTYTDYNYSIDLTYLGGDSVHLKINTTLALPTELKEFNVSGSASEVYTNQQNQYGSYSFINLTFREDPVFGTQVGSQKNIQFTSNKMNSNYVESYIDIFTCIIYADETNNVNQSTLTIGGSSGIPQTKTVKRNY